MTVPVKPRLGRSGHLRPVATALCLAALLAAVPLEARADGPAADRPPAIGANAADPAAVPALAPIPGGEPAPRGGPVERVAALPGWETLQSLTGRGSTARPVDGALSAVLVFAVASVAPAILLMTTSFVRISVVLSLLRQGLGVPGLPSNQIVTSLALFLSLLVMWPVWSAAYREGVVPFQEGRIGAQAAFERGSTPVRRWMAAQIERSGNRQTMLMFLARHPVAPPEVKSYDDVPLETLLPAFLVSELETAFSMGVRLLLPFLVLDLLVAAVLASTGLATVAPSTVALPLKLVVFVMADGWSIVVQSLLDSLHAAG